MDFAQPAFLSLLILVPCATVFLVWSARRRRSAIARLGTPSLISDLSAHSSSMLRGRNAALWFIGLVTLIVALARPLLGSYVETRLQRGIQVMVVLDVSTSMLAEDMKPNRLEQAKLTVRELMPHLQGSELGLVLFSGAAFIHFPLTSDYSAARSFLDAAGPQTISRPGTALAEGIQVALTGFPSEISGNRVILVLTDGENHEGDALTAAKDAAEAGVIIHTVGYGSPVGEPIPVRDETGALLHYRKNTQSEIVLSRLDEVLLKRIAADTGGVYQRASGGETAAIIEAISALDGGESTTPFQVRGVERFQWFAGVALLAFSAEFLTNGRKIRAARSRKREE
jgi:Ca-activated chloride channel family protein